MLPIGFVCALMGVIAKSSFPDVTAASALPLVIMSLNPVLSGITLAALWAADVSTACNLLLSSATLFSRDIYKQFVNPTTSDANLLKVTKSSVLVLGAVTLVLAMTVSGIIQTLMVGLSLTAAFSVVVLFTLFLPGLCRKNSAFYTLLAGLITLIAWQTLPAIRLFPHVIYMEWAVCTLVFLLSSVLDPTPVRSTAPSVVAAAEE